MLHRTLLCTVLAAFTATACVQDPYTGQSKLSKTAIGSGLGALVGAGAGSLTGKGSTDRRQKAMIGAGIGALAGGGAGYYMDRQEAKLRTQLQSSGVSVTRNGNNIMLNMPGNITFASDSSAINSAFYGTLESVAIVLREYNQTMVDVIGHTDSTGDDSYNMQLSQQRAQSVSSYLQANGVIGQRLMARGMGESSPIASNSSESGKAQNRRVEIRLAPITQ